MKHLSESLQENTISIEDDTKLHPLFKVLDILSAFDKLHELWSEANPNKKSPQAKAVGKLIEYMNDKVDQIAEYLAINGSETDISISIDFDSLKGKKFVSIIRRQDEWKELKKLVKQIDMSVTMNQTLTFRAIVSVLMDEVVEFLSYIE